MSLLALSSFNLSQAIYPAKLPSTELSSVNIRQGPKTWKSLNALVAVTIEAGF